MNNTIQKEKHINKKTKKTIIIVSSVVVVFIILISVAASIFLDTKNTVKNYRRNYNINEINVATNNTFKKLSSNTVSILLETDLANGLAAIYLTRAYAVR